MIDIREFYGLAGLPVVVALTQATKRRVTDARWWPLISLAWAVALNLLLALALHTDLATAVVVGIVVGLAAAGLWDVGRAPGKKRASR